MRVAASNIKNLFIKKDIEILPHIDISLAKKRYENISKPNDSYIMIDGKNTISNIDEYNLENIYTKFSTFIENEDDRYERINRIMNRIFERFESKAEIIFSICSNLGKQIEKDKKKINKELVEEYLDKSEKEIKIDFHSQSFVLDKNSCNILGTLLSYAYDKIGKYKIKSIQKMIELRKKILKDKVNVFRDFEDYCKKNQKDPKKEYKVQFFKDNRKKYEILPEFIYLINKFSKINEIKLNINSLYEENLTKGDCLYIQMTILNLTWICDQLESIKFDFIINDIEKQLYIRYNEDLKKITENLQDSFKTNNTLLRPYIYNRKFDFTDSFKINKEKRIGRMSKFYQAATFSQINDIGIAQKFLKPDIGIFTTLFDKLKDPTTKTLLEIVKSNLYIFELIILCLYSLNNIEQKTNLEIFMNDCFNGEFLTVFRNLYNLDWVDDNFGEFHIYDLLLYNNVTKYIKKLNLEINTLDPTTFDKVIDILLCNSSIGSFNLSFFSADISYTSQLIYKSFQGTVFADKLNQEYDSSTYLFNEIKGIDDRMLDYLSIIYIYNLLVLYEVIMKMNLLREIGFFFDIPINLRQKNLYMNSIQKFILNILNYVSKNPIKKLCLISPYTKIDSRFNPDINNNLKNVDFNNRALEELSIQLQFFHILNINKMVTLRLKKLNIGDLDTYTLKVLCEKICSHSYNKDSSLEELSISLLSSITELNTELIFVFEKLFKIKICTLSSLNLYTNIFIRDKLQYLHLLKIIDKNWISQYTITFNRDSKAIINELRSNTKDLKYIVSRYLESNLLNSEDILKFVQTKNQAELDELVKNVELKKDPYDEIYWFLKYIFEKVYTDDLKNDARVKDMIFDILKYIYFIKVPKIFH